MGGSQKEPEGVRGLQPVRVRTSATPLPYKEGTTPHLHTPKYCTSVYKVQYFDT